MAQSSDQTTGKNLSPNLRVQGVQGDCGCPPNPADQQRGAPVEMPGAPTGGTVKLTERELLIYKAGQAFGAAQALRQSAEAAQKLAKNLNGAAQAQAQAGQTLLDEALALKLPPDSFRRKLPRVVKAVAALLGDDD